MGSRCQSLDCGWSLSVGEGAIFYRVVSGDIITKPRNSYRRITCYLDEDLVYFVNAPLKRKGERLTMTELERVVEQMTETYMRTNNWSRRRARRKALAVVRRKVGAIRWNEKTAVKIRGVMARRDFAGRLLRGSVWVAERVAWALIGILFAYFLLK